MRANLVLALCAVALTVFDILVFGAGLLALAMFVFQLVGGAVWVAEALRR